MQISLPIKSVSRENGERRSKIEYFSGLDRNRQIKLLSSALRPKSGIRFILLPTEVIPFGESGLLPDGHSYQEAKYFAIESPSTWYNEDRPLPDSDPRDKVILKGAWEQDGEEIQVAAISPVAFIDLMYDHFISEN